MTGRPQRTLVQFWLAVALFAVAAAVTTLAIRRWRGTKANPNYISQESLNNTPGVSEGERVSLPNLPRLVDGYVDLNTVKEKYLLCAFISTECPGCAKDQPFWEKLNEELAGKNVAFYLISVDDDRSRVERFVEAYEFQNLPVLYDPKGQTLMSFKIKVLPQYVLLTEGGRVMGRWNGIRHYDPKQSNAMDKLSGLLDHLSAPRISTN